MTNDKLTAYLANKRIERANRLNDFAVRRQQMQYESQLRKQEEAERARVQQEELERQRIDNASFFEKLGHTLGDFFGNVGAGLSSGIEGIIDAGAGIVGLFGDKDFKQRVKNWAAYDWTSENITNPLNQALDKSWLKDGGIIEGVAQGVGQMLPMIAVQAIPGAGQALSTGMFVSSAAGRGMQDAWQNEDVGYGQGFAYGTASGLIELLIEKASGGIGGSEGGKILGKQVFKGTAGKIASTVVGEGLEEVAADLIDPLLKRATGVDKNAKAPTLQELGKTFAIGGLTGAAIGGATRQFTKSTSIRESMQEHNTLERKADNLWKNDKLNEKTEARINEQLQSELTDASNLLKRMNPEKRAKTIEKFNLQKQFNSDGEIIAKTAQSTLTADMRGSITPSLYRAVNDGEIKLKYKPTIEAVTERSKEVKDYALEMSPKSKVVITDDFIGSAAFSRDNDILYINNKYNGEQLATETAIHEMAHSFEGTLTEKFFAETVLDMDETNLNKLIEDKITKYAKHGVELDEKGAYVEVLAENSEKLLGNEESIKRIAVKNKGAAARIYHWIADKITRLKNLTNKTAREQYNKLRKAEELYATAIKEAHGEDVLKRIRNIASEDEWAEFEKELDAEMKKDYNNGERYSLKENENGKGQGRGVVSSKEQGREIFLDNARRDEQAKSGREAGGIEVLPNRRGKTKSYYAVETAQGIRAFVDSVSVKKEFSPKTKTTGIGTVLINEINDSALPQYLKDVKAENKDLGIETHFTLGSFMHNGNIINDAAGFFDPTDSSILIRLDILDEGLGISNALNHERTHYLQREKPSIYRKLLNKVRDKVGADWYATVLENTKQWGFDDTPDGRFRAEREFMAQLIANVPEIVKIIGDDSFVDEIITEARVELAKIAGHDIRYSLDTDSKGRKLTEAQAEFFKDSKIRDEQGRLLSLYHQTDADFTVFDLNKQGAGTFDSDTPKGVYLKHISDDIGLKGQKQMELYASIANPFYAYDRADLNALLNKNKSIKESFDKLKLIDEKHNALFETEDEKYNQTAQKEKRGEISESQAEKIYEDTLDSQDKIINEWKSRFNAEASQRKVLIENFLRNNGYDGIILKKDEGSFNRNITTYLALSPNQVKNIDNKNPTGNPDIRYSLPANLKITTETIGAHSGQVDMRLMAKVDSEIAGYAEFAEYDGIPYIQMIEVNEKYRRRGIATKLLQELQKKYRGKEIDFGGTTEDGTKLLASATKTVENKKYTKIVKELKEIGEKLVLNERKFDDGTITDEEYDGWNDLHDRQTVLEKELLEVKPQKTLVRFSLKDGESAKVLTKIPKQQQTRKEKVLEFASGTKLALQIKTVNAQAGIEHAAKKLGIENMEVLTNSARAATNAAYAMLDDSQFDAGAKKVGDGLKKIYKIIDSKFKYDKAKNAEYKQKFHEYLLHYHNIDRMAQGKPVFGESITANDSKAAIAEYDKTNPEFKATAEKVWKYNNNLLQYRVDTGLITQKQADNLRKMYPHYVPTFRDINGGLGTGALSGKYNLAVKKTIKAATGSDADILPIDIMIGRQTVETIRAARVNAVAKSLYDAAVKAGELSADYVTIEKVGDTDIDYSQHRPKNNEVSFFDNGKKVTMKVSKEIFEGFDAFAPQDIGVDNPLTNISRKINNTFKKLVTAWNPFFLVRNALKDLQDAGLYSKYLKSFPKNYTRAFKEMKANSDLWQKYKAMGGLSSSVFDYEKGIKKDGGKIKKALSVIETANIAIEQAPRFAEFMSSLEVGNSAEQALLDASDVTVNFGRTGTFTKKLNSTWIPFLNPTIQGFSKLYRTIVSKKSVKGWATLITKASLLALLPAILNGLMYKDDEDYEALSQRDKDNYFLFKVGKNFIKIPKGRVAAVIGGAGRRAVSGEDNAFEGYAENAWNQLSPLENVSRSIISPFIDASNNKTWYGGSIEGRRFDSVAPKDRYDESTSSIAKGLGKLLNVSPKKIHYIIDQYSGIVGDVLLPMTTPRAESGVLATNFIINPTLQNSYSTRFYDLLDKANYAKTNGDAVAAAKVRYLNKINSTVSELYAEKRDIEGSSISNAEKKEQSATIQALINQTLKSALTDIKAFEKTLQNFELSDESFDEDYREAQRLTFGAEYALKNYNKDAYEKAWLANAAGIDWDTFYCFYFDIRDIESDTDRYGNVISGSRKVKIEKYIKSLRLRATQKYILMGMAGYKNLNGSAQVKAYINSLKLSKAQKETLYEMSGYKVKKKAA